MKPPIKDTPKEDKSPNKGQAESTLVYTLYRKSPLKEDNLSTKDKTAGPKGVLIKRFHCTKYNCLPCFCRDGNAWLAYDMLCEHRPENQNQLIVS